ncbi:MAG: hypothetical protein HEEMFOPI_01870 [Holosporales bacterium]
MSCSKMPDMYALNEPNGIGIVSLKSSYNLGSFCAFIKDFNKRECDSQTHFRGGPTKSKNFCQFKSL